MPRRQGSLTLQLLACFLESQTPGGSLVEISSRFFQLEFLEKNELQESPATDPPFDLSGNLGLADERAALRSWARQTLGQQCRLKPQDASGE